MEHAVYDAQLLQNLANRLNSQSRSVVLSYTISAAILFSAIFYFVASVGHPAIGFISLAPVKSLGVGLLVGVVLGFVWGQRKSYRLKLAVQLALCQIQIENNTRASRKADHES